MKLYCTANPSVFALMSAQIHLSLMLHLPVWVTKFKIISRLTETKVASWNFLLNYFTNPILKFTQFTGKALDISKSLHSTFNVLFHMHILAC